VYRGLCRVIGVFLAIGGLAITPTTVSGEPNGFAGWEALRLIEQDGYPVRMRSADLDADGGDELVVVNFRNARLDLYGWKTPDAKTQRETNKTDTGHVNDLPMAREIELTEVPLRQPPIDVAVWPNPSGQASAASLLVLVGDPNRLLEVAADDDNGWKVSRQWDLLSGRPTGGDRIMHVIPSAAEGSARVLVSTAEGIQTVTLDAASSGASQAAARWLEPRESVGRNDWWLADLDDDGQIDLVEWTNNNQQSLRWYAGSGDGFQPAQALHDRGLAMAAVLKQPAARDELLVLESSPDGVVRRYRLGQGEASALGQQQPLALPGGEDAVWAKMTIDGQPHLVVADPNQPRVTLYAHGPGGWTPGESYPVSGKIQAMLELPGQPGSLVIWPEDGSDLHQSTWDGGRLTFPLPVGLSPDADDENDLQVLGLGQTAGRVWCVQRTGDDLLLHRISTLPPSHGGDAAETSPSNGAVVRFTDSAGKAERAIALDDHRLLVADKFTKGLRLVTLVDGQDEPEATKPNQLAKATIDEFRIFDNDAVTIGRLTDGVVQWLDDDLSAVDQVMLPDGRRIADLLLNADGSAWALQQGGGAIHRLTPDDAGVLRVDTTTRLDGNARSLHHDDDLGLLLRTGQGITRLAEGRPRELEVVQSLDARAGRPEGVRDTAVHRVMTLDLDGDGRDDALLADDIRHQLTAMVFDGEDHDQLKPLLSWPVFEDIAYPYGGGGTEQVREPRSVVALDLDGDGRQDLALLSHDRLLIYLGQEPVAATTHAATEAQP